MSKTEYREQSTENREDREIQRLKQAIRDVPDFPKKGILFKDITPVLNNPELFVQMIDLFYQRYQTKKIDKVIAVEARGFILGGALAYCLKAGFVPVRKKNKLPWRIFSATYQLEYGQDSLEIHRDALKKGEKVLVIDDVLATGGTVGAVTELVEKLGAKVIEVTCLIELTFLNGREKLKNLPVFSLITF